MTVTVGFYAWTLIWCIYLIASSPCCTCKLINDNTQHLKLRNKATIQITIMIDTQQQYIKLNIRGEISIIVVYNFWVCLYVFSHVYYLKSNYTELLATQSIKHIKACMHVWISTQEINSDISKWNICEKVATSRHLTTGRHLINLHVQPTKKPKKHVWPTWVRTITIFHVPHVGKELLTPLQNMTSPLVLRSY
jgi:hypothetical protein